MKQPRAAFRALWSVALFALTYPCGDAAAAIKCWTNKDGIRECGNTVPPEYAQQPTEVKSDSGLTIKRTERSKTPEEIARERAEQEVFAKKEAGVKKEADKKAAADKVLLATFSSEDDLVLARDGQLANVNSQIKLAESRIGKLQKSLDQLISKAADRERRGQRVPADLTKDIGNFRGQIADQRKFITAKATEIKTLTTKFAADIARFRELKSGSAKQ